MNLHNVKLTCDQHTLLALQQKGKIPGGRRPAAINLLLNGSVCWQVALCDDAEVWEILLVKPPDQVNTSVGWHVAPALCQDTLHYVWCLAHQLIYIISKCIPGTAMQSAA